MPPAQSTGGVSEHGASSELVRHPSLPAPEPRQPGDAGTGLARQLSLAAPAAAAVVAALAGGSAAAGTAAVGGGNKRRRSSKPRAPDDAAAAAAAAGDVDAEAAALVQQKKQQRMEKNRATAAAHRQRRLDHLAQLEARVAELEGENAELKSQLQLAAAAAAAAAPTFMNQTLPYHLSLPANFGQSAALVALTGRSSLSGSLRSSTASAAVAAPTAAGEEPAAALPLAGMPTHSTVVPAVAAAAVAGVHQDPAQPGRVLLWPQQQDAAIGAAAAPGPAPAGGQLGQQQVQGEQQREQEAQRRAAAAATVAVMDPQTKAQFVSHLLQLHPDLAPSLAQAHMRRLGRQQPAQMAPLAHPGLEAAGGMAGLAIMPVVAGTPVRLPQLAQELLQAPVAPLAPLAVRPGPISPPARWDTPAAALGAVAAEEPQAAGGLPPAGLGGALAVVKEEEVGAAVAQDGGLFVGGEAQLMSPLLFRFSSPDAMVAAGAGSAEAPGAPLCPLSAGAAAALLSSPLPPLGLIISP